MQNKDQKHTQLLQLIEHAQISLNEARSILGQFVSDTQEQNPARFGEPVAAASNLFEPSAIGSSRVIEGAFDGQGMNGNDGKTYSIPSNYASKSKLVDGDQLKLTIQPDGSFVYKQVGPIDRKRVKGVLHRDIDTDQFRVLAEGKSYRVLTASVTYFKGNAGDEVVLLLPREKTSLWGAVENIIPRSASSVGLSEEGELKDSAIASDFETYPTPQAPSEISGHEPFPV